RPKRERSGGHVTYTEPVVSAIGRVHAVVSWIDQKIPAVVFRNGIPRLLNGRRAAGDVVNAYLLTGPAEPTIHHVDFRAVHAGLDFRKVIVIRAERGKHLPGVGIELAQIMLRI